MTIRPVPVYVDVPIPDVPDQWAVVWPDGAWFIVTRLAAESVGMTQEQRARTVAEKVGGRAVRVITTLEATP